MLYIATSGKLLVVDPADGEPAVAERLEGPEPETLAAHPDDPERVFCGTFTDGLYRSTDAGRNWERVGTDTIDPDEDPETAERRGAAGGISVMSVAIDPSDPSTVWAGTEPSAVFRSTDGGDSWEQLTGLTGVSSSDDWAFPPRPYTHHVRWLEIDPSDPDRVYVGIEAGALVITPDGGETWIDRPEGSRRDNHTLATHPDAPGRVYSAAGDGYAESNDSGQHWTHPQDGLEHTYVWGLAVDSGDPDTVLVSSAHGAGNAHGHGGSENADAYVYRRTDGPWERVDGLPTGEGVVRATLGAGDPGEFYAANNHGLFRSTDRGEHWQQLGIDWRDRVGNTGARELLVVS